MPCIHVKTNIKIENSKELKKQLGQVITAFPGKSENWLMIVVDDQCDMYFQGNDDPCAIVETTILGEPTRSASEKYSQKVTQLLEEYGISGNRIYVSVIPVDHWAYDGQLF